MSEQQTVRKILVNTDVYSRVWLDLQRLEDRIDKDGNVVAAAGSTLELEPQESAATMVPPDFADPWLKEAKVGTPKRTGPKETSTSETRTEG